MDAADHLAGVDRVIGRIRAGDVYQLNLCTRLTGELRSDPLALFVRTAGAVRPSYGAHLPTGETTTLVSLSPERFLSVHGREVVTSPIKGTTSRSEDPDGSRLRSSAKDVAENIMITDLMRNDLSRVCAPGSVVVTGLLELQAHPGVWHLVSTVRGDLEPAVTVADLLAATYPPGSVTGAPKSSALRAIAAEEPYARGAYTGAAGLITVDDRADFSVLIRTFETAGDTVQLGVGGGITVDSVPVLEWQECLHKAEPLALAAGSRLTVGIDYRPARVPELFAARGVFESILVQHGQVLRLADHLARLARSVRELYGTSLPEDLATRVRAAGGWRPARRRAAGGRWSGCTSVRASRDPRPGHRDPRSAGTPARELPLGAGHPQRVQLAAQVAAPRPSWRRPSRRLHRPCPTSSIHRGEWRRRAAATSSCVAPTTSGGPLPPPSTCCPASPGERCWTSWPIGGWRSRSPRWPVATSPRPARWCGPAASAGSCRSSACDGRALETDGEPARWSRWLGVD